jgi:hypothetical protein
MHGDHRDDRVHRGSLPLGVLGTGHPMASLLSKVGCTSQPQLSYGGEADGGSLIGVGAAGLWNYMTLFVNTFLKNGLNQASILVHTGHLPRPDLFISVVGWLGNLAVIVGCLWVCASLPNKQRSGGGRNGRFLRAHYCAVPAALLGPFPWLVASALHL